MSLISIIIPCYNYGRFLARAIQSALDQDYSHIEVLVVNDGSTDDSLQVAESFGEKIRVLSKPNGGLSSARNYGVEHAKGDFIVFLDADDWMTSHAVRRFMEVMASLPAEAGVVACYSRFFLADGTSNEPQFTEPGRVEEIFCEDVVLSRRSKSFVPYTLIRRDVFQRVGGFDLNFGRLGSEDRDFWIRVASKFRIFRVHEVLLNYVIHGENMSGDPGRQLPGMLYCLKKAKHDSACAQHGAWFWAQVYAYFHYQASIICLDAGRPTTALKHSFLSLVRFPLPMSARVHQLPATIRLKRFLVCCRELLKLGTKEVSKSRDNEKH